MKTKTKETRTVCWQRTTDLVGTVRIVDSDATWDDVAKSMRYSNLCDGDKEVLVYHYDDKEWRDPIAIISVDEISDVAVNDFDMEGDDE
jgi:hypothetical protein